MKASLLFLFALFLVACVPDGVLRHDMRVLPDYGWRRRDTLVFDIDSSQSDVRLWFCVRADASFAYDTLWLRLDADTVAIPATALRGRNLRQSEWEGPLPHPGRLTVTHLMRRDPLSGIREVGVKLTRP